MSTQSRHRKRCGNVLLLTLFAMVGMFGVLALTVDVGYLHAVDTELQRSADAAALSGAWELYRQKEMFHADTAETIAQTQATSAQYARANHTGSVAPELAAGDTEIGFLANSQTPGTPLDTSDATRFNAVKVSVQRSEAVNGSVPLFFARVLGFQTQSLGGSATAMYLNNFNGFRTPSTGNPNIQILPFALDKETWDAMLGGEGVDNWRWDEDSHSVISGPDGILEVNLFPQGTGSPGNRGTVDIGSADNSTRAITTQIYDGISPQDLVDLGKPLEFDADGTLDLNGDTGLSASVQKALNDIKGEARIIPLFTEVVHPGNNANYTIVQFVGIRVMEAKLTGSMSNKRVLVQPANIQIHGGVPGPAEQKTQFIFSPVWLVR